MLPPAQKERFDPSLAEGYEVLSTQLRSDIHEKFPDLKIVELEESKKRNPSRYFFYRIPYRRDGHVFAIGSENTM